VILEHSKDPVSAKWNHTTNRWDIGEKKKFRWCSTKNKPESDWFYDITDALTWIINHNESKEINQKIA
jgi:hypothetical protein